MPSNLDERLKELCDKLVYNSDYSDVERTITQIKQAFADEGYIQHDEYGNVKVYKHNATNVMTGQEWYERFEKELYAYNEDIAARFKELYPGIEVIMVEKGYMPTDTNLVLSKERLHPGLTAEDSE